MLNKAQRKEFYRFMWRQSWGLIILAAFGFAIVMLFLWSSGWQATWWGNWLEPLIGLLTLVVAWRVWRQQMQEEWEEDRLPKRLTAHFFYKTREVMRCEGASLTSEGDIRALAQQIGRHIAKGYHEEIDRLPELDFVVPDVIVKGPNLNQEGTFVDYEISFTLVTLPVGKDKHNREVSLLDPQKCRVWKKPFVQTDDQSPTYGQPIFIEQFNEEAPVA